MTDAHFSNLFHLEQTKFWADLFDFYCKNYSSKKAKTSRVYCVSSENFNCYIYQFKLFFNIFYWHIPSGFAVNSNIDLTKTNLTNEIVTLIESIKYKAKENNSISHITISFNFLDIFSGVGNYLLANGYSYSKLEESKKPFSQFINLNQLGDLTYTNSPLIYNVLDNSWQKLVAFWDSNFPFISNFFQSSGSSAIRDFLKLDYKINCSKSSFEVENCLNLIYQNSQNYSIHGFAGFIDVKFIELLLSTEHSKLVNLYNCDGDLIGCSFGVIENSVFFNIGYVINKKVKRNIEICSILDIIYTFNLYLGVKNKCDYFVLSNVFTAGKRVNSSIKSNKQFFLGPFSKVNNSTLYFTQRVLTSIRNIFSS